eukprot:CAMPEP_0172541572 /NCGR_PEP_ID=MMETSP1067-20121228/12358_1 /TAXON_ID=265564 ORGANISM="Thalassiosira punctigera, Strain Tpunct2005C2" /NCGR_SAMPLE_ID=MMETSP1067 /ASSEMBLY_ACC=CAM_ASM_000444 /LENGTH=88 /DNA_ID=CAMNT_0013327637 /DNA_START=51 /DNA_END=314 /DNA_ORIENTATION=-
MPTLSECVSKELSEELKKVVGPLTERHTQGPSLCPTHSQLQPLQEKCPVLSTERNLQNKRDHQRRNKRDLADKKSQVQDTKGPTEIRT